MTAFADIESAVVQAWKSGGLAYPTELENRHFTRPDGPWCAIKVLPVTARVAALGVDAPIEHVVLVQVDVNRPRYEGYGLLLADCDAVAAMFTPGADFEYGNMRLRVESCDRSSIMVDDTNATVALTVKMRGWQFRA